MNPNQLSHLSLKSIFMKHTRLSSPLAALVLTLSITHAGPATSAEARLTGDIGVGATRAQTQTLGAPAKTEALPYLNFEYGPLFTRVDSFGVKALPLGYGHVEFGGQYRGDGYDSNVLNRRQNSVPLGLGTLQITPIGAFWLQVLHDFGKSGGNLLQARYLAELRLGPVTVYPELGVEYQSRAYTSYYHGTTDADAATLGQAYRPGSALNPYVGAMVELRLADRWYLNAYARRTFSDNSIARSPLVVKGNFSSLLLALSYRF
jgi:outer membrane scaffolding protein for murein synthesis (MipA/OmpV family)